MNVIVEKDNLLKTQEPYDYRKSTFLKNLKKKNKEIKDGRIILFMKHQYLKRIVNLFQISIIFCSTIITFFESLKRQILLSEDLTQIISICLSTYIAISTAIFKFIKIDDKKEEIYKLMQNFNDLENNIMNKIQKVKLLQDKFDDETKFNTKTPYILNALYNSIIQTNPNGSYLLKNSQNNDQDDNDQNGGIITDKDGNTVCKKQPSKKKKDKEKDKKKSNENNVDYESPCPNELNLLFDRNKYLDSLFYNEDISKKDINKHTMDVRRNTIFKYNNDTQKLQKMGDLTNKVINNKTKFPTKLKKMPSMSALFEDRENSDETSQDNISSTISDTHSSHGEDKHISTNILQQTMKQQK